MDTATSSSFDHPTLASLRQRKSEKWTRFPGDVLPAFVAEMDFALASPVRSAIQAALDRSDCGYASSACLGPAYARFAARRWSWDVDPQSVFGVPDVMAGIEQAMYLFTQPGGAVVINPPVYPPFFETIVSAGRTLAEVPLVRGADRNWSLDFAGIERAFAAGAQAFLLCSPHNPVGRVWTRDELERIAAIGRRFGVAVISDEIHAPLTMPEFEFVPYLHVASQDARSIAVTSASKAWNIPGLKCGLMIASPAVLSPLRERVRAVPTAIESRTGHFGVLASIAAFRSGGEWLDELRAYLDANHRLFADLLARRLPMLHYVQPQATYLAWVDCTALGEDDPAKLFLERGRVALERGSRFGIAGRRFVRVTMGTSRAILTEIVERMCTALEATG